MKWTQDDHMNIILHALKDASNFRQYHCRKDNATQNGKTAALYDTVAELIAERKIAVVPSDTKILVRDGRIEIPTADMETVLLALFLASAHYIAENHDLHAERFVMLADRLGDNH